MRLEGDAGASGHRAVHGAPVYRLRGSLLPLVYLNRELRLASRTPRRPTGRREAVNIVVLQADDRQFGLVVDEINDTEEIVVKPLGKQLKGITCFAGATIMGDGKVALILDVLGLAQARQRRLARRTTGPGRPARIEAMEATATRSRRSCVRRPRRRAHGDAAGRWRGSRSFRRRRWSDRARVRGAVPRQDSAAGGPECGAGRAAQTGTRTAALAGGQRAGARRCWCAITKADAVGLVVERIVDIVEDTREM